MSGIRYWSLSAIRVKPSIDEPSNQVPCLTEPSSWWIGIVTALTWPMMSVNWSWMKRMPLALGGFDLRRSIGARGHGRMPPRPSGGSGDCQSRQARIRPVAGGAAGRVRRATDRALSTGRAAPGTSAAARGRRRRASRARRRPREARSWAGMTSVAKAPGLGLHRARLVRLVLGVLERRDAHRPASRPDPTPCSQTALIPRDDGAAASWPRYCAVAGRIIVGAMSRAQLASMLLDLDVALPVDLDPRRELALGQDAEPREERLLGLAVVSDGSASTVVRLFGRPRRAASACHSSE